MGKGKFARGSIKRRFGKKIYTNVASKPTKREAQARAEGWRKQGYLARIVPSVQGYDIYINP